MLRDWTKSKKVKMISVHAERFFTRLIMKVDDYGCFYADEELLKADLFPYLTSSIREADITRWKAECQKAGLIALYESNSNEYLQIIDFKQRLDRAKSKFPLPNENQHVNGSQEVVNENPPEQNRTELEKNLKPNAAAAETQKQVFSDAQVKSFREFEKWTLDNAPNVSKMKEPFNIDQYLVLSKDFNIETIKDLLKKMHNYAPLLKKNNSANLTFRNWSKRDYYSDLIPEGKNDRLSAAVKTIEGGRN